MPDLTPLTRKPLVLLLFHAVFVTLILHVGCSVPRAGTLAHHLDAFVARQQAADSWKPMAAARAAAAAHPDESLYQEVFFRNKTKFQYPPTFAPAGRRFRASRAECHFVGLRIRLRVVIVSPIAWEHHYGVLLPLLAATTPQILHSPSRGRWTPAVLAASFVLTGQYFEPAQRLAGSVLNLFQSYVLLGALALLALWHRAARRGDPAAPPAYGNDHRANDSIMAV